VSAGPPPPGTLRREAPRGGPAPSPPDPGGGTGGEVGNGGTAPSEGDKPPDGEAPAPSPRNSAEEMREESKRGDSGADQGDPMKTGTPGRFWGMDLSPASSDMEVEVEGGGSKKRKSQETRDCSVFLAPLPVPPEKGGKRKKKKK